MLRRDQGFTQACFLCYIINLTSQTFECHGPGKQGLWTAEIKMRRSLEKRVSKWYGSSGTHLPRKHGALRSNPSTAKKKKKKELKERQSSSVRSDSTLSRRPGIQTLRQPAWIFTTLQAKQSAACFLCWGQGESYGQREYWVGSGGTVRGERLRDT
jgi:hypothetical protein